MKSVGLRAAAAAAAALIFAKNSGVAAEASTTTRKDSAFGPDRDRFRTGSAANFTLGQQPRAPSLSLTRVVVRSLIPSTREASPEVDPEAPPIGKMTSPTS